MYFVQTYNLTEEARNNYQEFLEWYKQDRREFILAMESVKSVWAASNLVGGGDWDIEEWQEIEDYGALDRMRHEWQTFTKKSGWDDRVKTHARFLIPVSTRIARELPVES